MKTAVSLPDRVHRDADRLARRLGKSRSRLYSEALQLYLARYDADGVTDALNAVSDETETALEPDLRSVSADVLRRSEW
jgi:metal-responsive CopG/Arc/MetJ family transcriptional regulator